MTIAVKCFCLIVGIMFFYSATFNAIHKNPVHWINIAIFSAAFSAFAALQGWL